MLGTGTTDMLARTGRVLLVALVLGLAVMSFSAPEEAGASQWRLKIMDAACVKGEKVLLGDIAEAYGEVPERLWQELSMKELWASPPDGRAVTVVRSKLQGLLKYYLGAELAAMCALPSQLSIQKGGLVITADELRKRISEFVRIRLAGLDGQAELRDFRLPPSVFLANEFERLEITSARDVNAGRLPLRLNIMSSGDRIRQRLSASVFINLWRSVPCAAHPIHRGAAIKPENITFKRKNTAYYQDAWDGKGGPWRTIRSVGAGQIISLDIIEPMPAVAKGDKVVLVYQGDRIKLSVKALALGDGSVGDDVSVRNLQSNKTVQATVVDEHTVAVR